MACDCHKHKPHENVRAQTEKFNPNWINDGHVVRLFNIGRQAELGFLILLFLMACTEQKLKELLSSQTSVTLKDMKF